MSYIVANKKQEMATEAARYRHTNSRRIKSSENGYINVSERLLIPNFLLCKDCFWSASEVYRTRISMRSACPACGHEGVIYMPIWGVGMIELGYRKN
jgi:hypothetical protein